MTGKKIAQYRRMANLTQEGLANKIGKSTGFISMLETDRTTSSDETLQLIADALNVSLKDIKPSDKVKPINEIIELLTDKTKKGLLKWKICEEIDSPITYKSNKVKNAYYKIFALNMHNKFSYGLSTRLSDDPSQLDKMIAQFTEFQTELESLYTYVELSTTEDGYLFDAIRNLNELGKE